MNLGLFFTNIKNWLVDFLNEIQALIMAILPDSPFVGFVVPPDLQEILSYINWIVPFYLIGNILLAWLSCITIYYSVQIILRWIKTIQ